jgi:hypothetical protein
MLLAERLFTGRGEGSSVQSHELEAACIVSIGETMGTVRVAATSCC